MKFEGEHRRMKLSEIINSLNLGNISIICFLVLSLVEISPIKINPWSMLIKWLAKLLGILDLRTEIVQVRDRMDELEKKIDNMKISEEEKEQLKEALAARRRILRFNDELLLKIKHSKEMFDDILSDISDYDRYVRTHPDFVNQKAVFAEQNVGKAYKKCMEENDFL
jgi:hypothetical protein